MVGFFCRATMPLPFHFPTPLTCALSPPRDIYFLDPCHRRKNTTGIQIQASEKLSTRKKEKEDAAYLERVQARVEGVKRSLDGQRKKDLYKKVMREWADPDKRDSTNIETHKERIHFSKVSLRKTENGVREPSRPFSSSRIWWNWKTRSMK